MKHLFIGGSIFLYNSMQLYAVNRAVEFVPYVAYLNLAETGVTERHCSGRQSAMKQYVQYPMPFSPNIQEDRR
jgi:hypothetical protein